MIPAALLDTDTLSNVLRQNRVVLAHAHPYLDEHGVFTFSIITRYEVLRGLKAKRANVQEAAFETFCAANTILEITDSIIVKASEIYADLHRRGSIIGDADILIAATALEHGLALVTNNTKHFKDIAGLQLENWLVM